MTDSRVALGMDRLPWLPDEPRREPKRESKGSRGLLAWAFAAILLVAGASYWLGTRTVPQVSEPVHKPATQPSATMTLPEARRVEQTEEVRPVTVPEARPVTAPQFRPVAPVQRLPRRVPRSVEARVKRTIVTEHIDRVSKAQSQRPAVPAVRNTQSVRIWSPWESAGASGRVVQIGAFGSRQQAKLGWRYMVRAYPAVKRLQAVVVEARNSRGRPFYRFQIGTTSQAHSEVLCQRMERIRFSCAVVGLPGARKAVER